MICLQTTRFFIAAEIRLARIQYINRLYQAPTPCVSIRLFKVTVLGASHSIRRISIALIEFESDGVNRIIALHRHATHLLNSYAGVVSLAFTRTTWKVPGGAGEADLSSICHLIFPYSSHVIRD